MDMVVVGADSILADGSFVNKTGTHILALMSEIEHIPFYVLCDTLKIRHDMNPESEVGSDNELLANTFGDQPVLDEQLAASGVKVFNPTFETTPTFEHIKIVTENGIISTNQIKKYAEKAEHNRNVIIN